MTAKPSALSVWNTRSEADRDAWNNFRRSAAALINHIDADLHQHFGLGYTDVDALLLLSVAEGNRLRIVDLARGVSRSPSALTRLVDRLQRRSLVTRTRHSPADVSVEITPAGFAYSRKRHPTAWVRSSSDSGRDSPRPNETR